MIGETPISKEAKLRLRWMEHYAKYRNARLTCRHFAISADTFYTWKRKFDPANVSTLEDDLHNRRPKHTRRPLWTKRELSIIRRLKRSHPHLGKGKISSLLRARGINRSSATVGRMIGSLDTQST